MITDATDATVNPNSKGNIEVISVDHVANVDPLAAPQVQPRIMARQIPNSTARGQMHLGSPNILTDSGNRRIMVQDDSQVNVVEIGNIGLSSMGAQLWGMKVAQPGIDVITATDGQLIFNSQQNIFKIIQTDLITITVPNPPVAGTDYQFIVNHDLGFAPSCIAFIVSGPGSSLNVPLPFHSLSWDGVSIYQISAYSSWAVDTTRLTFTVGTGSASGFYAGNWLIRYYLLQETAGPAPAATEHGSTL